MNSQKLNRSSKTNGCPLKTGATGGFDVVGDYISLGETDESAFERSLSSKHGEETRKLHIGETGHRTLALTRNSKRLLEQLKQDDVEIARLEQKLGIQRRKFLPRAFKEDGLDDLVDTYLGGEVDHEYTIERKRKVEVEGWLRMKRRRALPYGTKSESDTQADIELITSEDGSDGLRGELSDVHNDGDRNANESAAHSKINNEHPPRDRQRENPYVAPVPVSIIKKYIPPALRQKQVALDEDSEVVARVRRQAHSLIARLSESNLLAILGDVEKLYLDYPRQYVTETMVEKLLEQVSIDGALSSSAIMLIAGFATALFYVIGIDFGAHFVQQSTLLFRLKYNDYNAKFTDRSSRKFQMQKQALTYTSKPLLNLTGLLAELYNFRTIGPNLIYDYIRIFLRDFRETNTELLLRLFDVSGQRLRQDDPGSLESVISFIQSAVVSAGGERKLSARTRHMIQRLRELRKGQKKTGRDADRNSFGYAERIWKILRDLINSRNLQMIQPLRVSLNDIEQAHKNGKWWLVGASWIGDGDCNTSDRSKGDIHQNAEKKKAVTLNKVKTNITIEDDDSDGVLGMWHDAAPDVAGLEQLAREQGMNTSARRSIFVTLLTAIDSNDAHRRLLQLGLNKHDRREIANVLIRCVGSEEFYNHYYALVAQQVCMTDNGMARAFRICLWRVFQRLGEPIFDKPVSEDDVDDDGDDGEATHVRRLINMAKMYGYLLTTGCLKLDVLKCLQLARLQAKTRIFVEILVITLFEQSYKVLGDANSSNNKKKKRGDGGNVIWQRFTAIGDDDDLCRDLDHFLDILIQNSTILEVANIATAFKWAKKALNKI